VARQVLAARCAYVTKPDDSAKLDIPEEKITGRRTRRVQNNRKGLHARLGGKHGRFRGNMMGKRVDYCARSPIGPAPPNFEIWHLGVPRAVAEILTKPERVNRFSMNKLRQCIVKGPHALGGATFVRHHAVATGPETMISLALMSKKERVEYSENKLQIGDIVQRHMQDGDWIMFNRQPTLHRGSWQAFQTRIVEDYNF